MGVLAELEDPEPGVRRYRIESQSEEGRSFDVTVPDQESPAWWTRIGNRHPEGFVLCLTSSVQAFVVPLGPGGTVRELLHRRDLGHVRAPTVCWLALALQLVAAADGRPIDRSPPALERVWVERDGRITILPGAGGVSSSSTVNEADVREGKQGSFLPWLEALRLTSLFAGRPSDTVQDILRVAVERRLDPTARHVARLMASLWLPAPRRS
ncbi:MAG: hypothetical protein HC923_11940 [Myxococcales bacterium]|nr:hypothetical protein [Myxococcales bacterium]